MVAVTRLAHEMKLEGLLSAMSGLIALNSRRRVDLVIVGDVPARSEVLDGATAANRAIGRPAVRLTGALVDPRPAYAAGDIQLAMGSSALRSLAFGKPTVVQGERGFWRLLDEQTLDYFLWSGWYGVGRSAQEGQARFLAEVEPVICDPANRVRLGRFGRTSRSAISRWSARRRCRRRSTRRRLTGRRRSTLVRSPVARPVSPATGPAGSRNDCCPGRRETTSTAGRSLPPGRRRRPSPAPRGGPAFEHVAIVVVTYNSAAQLPGFLESVPAGCAGVDVEVVVADNGSATNRRGSPAVSMRFRAPSSRSGRTWDTQPR